MSLKRRVNRLERQTGVKPPDIIIVKMWIPKHIALKDGLEPCSDFPGCYKRIVKGAR